MQREPRDPIAFANSMETLSERVTTMLLEAGTVAAHHFLTTEEQARFDLTMMHPGPETFANGQKLNKAFDDLTHHAIKLATVVILDLAFKVNPLDGKEVK